MNYNPYELLNQAAKIAFSRHSDSKSYLLGAVGIRSDGAKVQAYNGGAKRINLSSHAETRLTRKLDRGAVVFVARVTRDGCLALAKPCDGCKQMLVNKGVRRVYYSIGPGEYDFMDLKLKNKGE